MCDGFNRTLRDQSELDDELVLELDSLDDEDDDELVESDDDDEDDDELPESDDDELAVVLELLPRLSFL